jgi:hypothetical protein
MTSFTGLLAASQPEKIDPDKPVIFMVDIYIAMRRWFT